MVLHQAYSRNQVREQCKSIDQILDVDVNEIKQKKKYGICFLPLRVFIHNSTRGQCFPLFR